MCDIDLEVFRNAIIVGRLGQSLSILSTEVKLLHPLLDPGQTGIPNPFGSPGQGGVKYAFIF